MPSQYSKVKLKNKLERNKKVLTIDRDYLKKFDLKEGINELSQFSFKEIIKHGKFIPFGDYLKRPQKVEILPYPIITNFEKKIISLFEFPVKENGEKNLGLSFKKHITNTNKLNFTKIDLFKYELQRHLAETLIILPEVYKNNSIKYEGIIRTFNSVNDLYKLGILFTFQTKNKHCSDTFIYKRNNEDNINLKFVKLEYLTNNYSQLENWAKVSLDNIFLE
ncbi:MAG: hypothetical protein ACOCP8_09815 [archaeon]